MKNIIGMMLFVLAGTLAGCGDDDKALSVQERMLLDVRHDYLRCEIYIDRLRDLYDVTDTEQDGLMGDELDPGPDDDGGALAGGGDDPLTGGHDGPLTGGHDDPLTGGHDDPLTGGHDQMPADLEKLKESRDACWDATQRLVDKYNSCIVDFVACRNGGGDDCYTEYQACLVERRIEGE